MERLNNLSLDKKAFLGNYFLRKLLMYCVHLPSTLLLIQVGRPCKELQRNIQTCDLLEF